MTNVKTNVITVVLIALGAAGCGKKAPACGEAINKGMQSATASAINQVKSPQGQNLARDLVGREIAMLTTRCTEDKWSAEVTACMAEATTQKAVEVCRHKLGQEQRAKLSEAQRQLRLDVGGMHMQGGLPGHPPLLHGTGSPQGFRPPTESGAATGSAGSAATPPAAPAPSVPAPSAPAPSTAGSSSGSG